MGHLVASLCTWRSGASTVLGLAAALVVVVVLLEHAFARQRHFLRRLRSVHELIHRWLWITALTAFPVGLALLAVAWGAIADGGSIWMGAGAFVLGLLFLGAGYRLVQRVGPSAPPELVKAVVLDRIKPAGDPLEFPFGMDVLPTPTSESFRHRRAVHRLVLGMLAVAFLLVAAAWISRSPPDGLVDPVSAALGWMPAPVALLIAGACLSLAVVLDLANRRFVLMPFWFHLLSVDLALPVLAFALAISAGVSWPVVAAGALAWLVFAALCRAASLCAARSVVAEFQVERTIASILDDEDDAVRAAWRVFGSADEEPETEFELESALETLAGREWLSAGAGEIGSLRYRVAGVHVDTFELRVRTVKRAFRSSNDGSIDPWSLPLDGPRDWHGGTTRSVSELAEPVEATLVTEWHDYVGWQASPPVRDVPALRRGLSAVAEAAIVRNTKIGSAVHSAPDEATDAFVRLATRVHVHRPELAAFLSNRDDSRLSDVDLRALRFPLYALTPEGGDRPTVWITGWRGVAASRLPISWPALAVAGIVPTLLVALSVYIVTAAASLVLP